MRRVFLVGMGTTTETALESLLERFEVVALARAGDDAVTAIARARSVPLLADLSVAALAAAIRAAAPDCVVVSSYDRILPADLVAERPFVNVHYSPLPRYRGRANVNWAVINGEPTAAISIHVLAPALDGGNILFQRQLPISGDDTVGDLYDRLNGLQRLHLGETVAQFLDGAAGVPQDEERATYGCTRLPRDGMIDWTQPAGKIAALVRALSPPFPGAHTYLEGKKLVVWRAIIPAGAPRFEGRVPGRVARSSRREGFADVLCGDGMIRLLEVQRPGEPQQPAGELLRSVKLTLGLSVEDLLARIEELERKLAAKGS
jgi:methionyl-tRNA formyltransferase